MPDDLAGMITAALDEMQRVAEAATPGPWVQSYFVDQMIYRNMDTAWKEHHRRQEQHTIRSYGPMGTHVALTTPIDHGVHNAAFIAANDPSAVLRQVAGMRELMESIFAYETTIDGEWGDCCRMDQIRAGKCQFTPVDEIDGLQVLARMLGIPVGEPASG